MLRKLPVLPPLVWRLVLLPPVQLARLLLKLPLQLPVRLWAQANALLLPPALHGNI
jgi:hypothetical protein